MLYRDALAGEVMRSVVSVPVRMFLLQLFNRLIADLAILLTEFS